MSLNDVRAAAFGALWLALCLVSLVLLVVLVVGPFAVVLYDSLQWRGEGR